MVDDSRIIQSSVHMEVGLSEIASKIQQKLAKIYDYKILALHLTFEDYDSLEPFMESLESLHVQSENWDDDHVTIIIYLDMIDQNRLDKFLYKNKMKINIKLKPDFRGIPF